VTRQDEACAGTVVGTEWPFAAIAEKRQVLAAVAPAYGLAWAVAATANIAQESKSSKPV
jgi:hypothetical protein